MRVEMNLSHEGVHINRIADLTAMPDGTHFAHLETAWGPAFLIVGNPPPMPAEAPAASEPEAPAVEPGPSEPALQPVTVADVVAISPASPVSSTSVQATVEMHVTALEAAAASPLEPQAEPEVEAEPTPAEEPAAPPPAPVSAPASGNAGAKKP